MERYSSYKPTSIQWLKEIPSHWEEKRAKYIYEKQNRLPEESDDVITCFRDGEVTLRKNRRTTGFTESLKEIGYQGIKKGDLVIHQMDAFAGATGVSDSDGKGTPVYSVCTPIDNQSLTKYHALVIRLMGLNGFIQSLYRGIRERSSDFRFETFARQTLPLPPLVEQEKIVSYLEGKTSKIDAYVAEKEKEIQLLQELKQKTIADAVTKGLNPNVKMKDSGISWIGMIPEHWEAKKIGSLFIERREKVSDKDYPALSVSKQGITPQLETAVKTDNGDNRKKVCKNDFVVNSRSDRKGSCGVSPYTGSVSLINIVLAPRENIEVQYYHHLFRSNDYIEEYYRIGRGIVADLWTTRYSEMRNIFVPFPPLDEQRAIVAYIDEKCQKIDTLVSELQAEIDNVKEYKQRLIADCVTGQVKI